MKLSEIAKRIDKSEKNKGWVNIEELGSMLNLNLNYQEQKRLTSFWIGNWYCTDSYVGYKMYFLDDEPVAFSFQTARKSPETFEWFGPEAVTKVRNYLLSLIAEDEEDLNFTYTSLDEEVGDSFKIHYNSEILNEDKATFQGEKVQIVSKIKTSPYSIEQELTIRLPSGEEKNVNVQELDFEYHLVD